MFFTGVLPLDFTPLVAFQTLDRFALLAVPFFILAGQIMALGGIAKKLLKVADELLGSLPGGYALTTILASLFFADLSGSGPGTVAAIGTLMIPAMKKQGYDPAFAAATCAAAGCLAVIIPPSNPMIVYGIAGDTSIGRLFLAGFAPGFLFTIALMIPAYWISKKNGWAGTNKRGSLRSVSIALWEAKWALAVPVIILGGIYSGVFTPTESAAVACLYALFVGLFLYREFTFRDLPRIFRIAALNIVTIMLIVSLVGLFGQVITILGAPAQIMMVIQQTGDDQAWLVLILINILLLFVGMIMDANAAIILLAPILLAVLVPMQVDPVHFGMVMIMNLAIGFLTPPVGVNLFVANAISGVPIRSVFYAAVPYLIASSVVLLLITFIPWISLAVPNYFYNR